MVDVDAEQEADSVKHTLVVANQTVGGKDLLKLLKDKAEEEPRRFIVICPVAGDDPTDEGNAAERLATTLAELEEAGLDAIGQVVHPDPFTAIQNAMRSYGADEIVISTFPETRSGWLRGDLVQRVRSATTRPVEHVVSEPSRGSPGQARWSPPRSRSTTTRTSTRSTRPRRTSPRGSRPRPSGCCFSSSRRSCSSERSSRPTSSSGSL